MASRDETPPTPSGALSGGADGGGGDYHEDHHDDEEVHEEEEGVQEWDEGGPSHCGYHESVHETLMAVGKGVHTVVGEPSPEVEQGVIKSVGNWFQEASYAVRDFVRGNKEVSDDASQTFAEFKEGALTAIMGENSNTAASSAASPGNENVPTQQ